MMDELISVVTVSYNAENCIEKTLTSILNQTYKKIELIVIDGNSTDNTCEIIRKYQDGISYWSSEPDTGIYHGMNKGIEKSHGEWIIFMNCGDVFSNETILQDLFGTGSYSSEIIYGDRINQYSFGEYVHKPDDLNGFEKDFPLFHQASFVRARLLKERPFNLKYTICADYESFYYFWKKGCSFQYVPVIIAKCECETGFSSRMPSQLRRIRENGEINGNVKKPILNFIYVLKTCCRVSVLSLAHMVNKKLYTSIYKWRCDSNSRMTKI